MRRSYLDMTTLSTLTFSVGEASRYNNESAMDSESLPVALAERDINERIMLIINDFISVALLVNIENHIFAVACACHSIIHQTIAEEVVEL